LKEREKIQSDFKKVKWKSVSTGEEIDWSELSGSETSIAESLYKANGFTQTALEYLGYTDDWLKGIISKARSGDKDARASLEKMYDEMQDFVNENLEI
jgi:hypothetical protein